MADDDKNLRAAVADLAEQVATLAGEIALKARHERTPPEVTSSFAINVQGVADKAARIYTALRQRQGQ